MVKSILENHNYSDISNAFDKLKHNMLVEESGKKEGRGRPEVYYKITEKGLALLIIDDPIPEKFWRAMMGFCYYSDEEVSLAKVEEFYQLFQRKYLRYSSGYNFSFQLDLFNKMSKGWFENMILNAGNKISLAQKILEVLSINPTITLHELARKTGESDEEKVKKILSYYTPILHRRLVVAPDNIDKLLAGNVPTAQYDDWNILLHNVVIVRRNAKGIDTYELSLFGVMLAITLVRYYDMDRLKLGLYYDNILFGEYYDKIASNYKKKIPLIFGKWYLLKRILKIFSAYNFDIILDKEARSKFMAGDNSKFYNSLIAVTLHNKKQLGEVQVKGLEEYGNYIENTISESPDKNIQEARKYISQKTNAVFQMIMKISVLLNPLDYDPVSFKEKAKEWTFFSSEQLKQLSHLYEIENTIEKALADEVSFIYYLNLHNDYRFQVMQPMKYYSVLVSNASKADYKEDLLFPKQSLFAILRCDKEIRERFSSLIENLVKYQKEAAETMSEFYEEISMERWSSNVVVHMCDSI